MKNQTKNMKKQQEIQALADKLNSMEPPKRHEGRSFYPDFDSYVKDYPEGELFRAWLTRQGRENVILLAMDRPDLHNSLPGNYLAAVVSTWTTISGGVLITRTQLAVHDSDDGLYVKRWDGADQTSAQALLNEMTQLAPFTARDCIEIFGLLAE